MQPIQRYGPLLDAAIIFSDILVSNNPFISLKVIPQALGMIIEMKDVGGPYFPAPLLTPADIALLKTPADALPQLQYVYEALTLTRRTLEGSIPLIGFCGSPWTLMAYMTEGHGTKMFSKCKSWLFNYPEESHFLLQTITDVCVGFLIGQVKAGAQLLQIFDSWAGELSPKHFKEFSAPYLLQIQQKVKEGLGLDAVPMILFAKGVHDMTIINEMQYDVVQLDMTIDVEASRAILKGTTLQGNMDPGCLYGSKDFIEEQVEVLFDSFGTTRWIANLGHGNRYFYKKFILGMHPDHDAEHLKWFLEAIRDKSIKYCNE